MPRFTIAFWLFLLCALSRADSETVKSDDWNLVFNDEFDYFDNRLWSLEDNIERHQAINSKDQVRIKDGKLIISAKTINGIHYTGLVTSKDKLEFSYGYIEISAKINTVEGAWIDWWMMHESMFTNKINKFGRADIPQELDIFEIRKIDSNGKYIGNGVFRCTHWNYYFDLEQNCEGVFSDNLGINDNNYHTFGLLRTKDKYYFYVDGVEISNSKYVTNLQFYTIFSVEILDKYWAGDIPSGGYNQDCLSIDYIRYYRPTNNYEK